MMEALFSPEALWFFIGALTHKFMSALMGYGRVALFAQDIISHSMRLLVTLTEDVASMRQLKYLHMKKGGATDEEVESVKEIDELALDNWKHSVITKFRVGYPQQLRGLVKFKTWEEAMVILTKELKKRRF
jgi:hypothetical protein